MAKYTPVSCIYVILNTRNGKIYIGQTQDFRERSADHKRQLDRKCHKNIHLQNSWHKYGAKSFKFKILEYCPIEKLDEREQHYLDAHIAKGICYNIALDAKAPTRGRKFTDEQKQRIAESHKGRTISDETRRKISESEKGKFVSAETRLKQSAAKKGKPPHNKGKSPSDETRRRSSESHKGKTASEETKQRMSIAMKLHHARKRSAAENISEDN